MSYRIENELCFIKRFRHIAFRAMTLAPRRSLPPTLETPPIHPNLSHYGSLARQAMAIDAPERFRERHAMCKVCNTSQLCAPYR